MEPCGSVQTKLSFESLGQEDESVDPCASEGAAPKPSDASLDDTERTVACKPAKEVSGLTPLQLAKKRTYDRLMQRRTRERRRALIGSLEKRVLDISSTWPHTDLQLVSEQNGAIKAENQRMLDSVRTIRDNILDLSGKLSDECRSKGYVFPLAWMMLIKGSATKYRSRTLPYRPRSAAACHLHKSAKCWRSRSLCP